MAESWQASEMMTIAAARALRNEDVCFVGIGLPSAACNLARLTHAPKITLIYESGTLGTRPAVLPLSIGDGELCETALTTVPVPENEEACRAYLARLGWPDGFRCPRCGHGRSWPVRGVLLECASCGCQTSVTAGTIFQDTRTPLLLWFRAMWWVTTQKNGASALGLQRVLGLKSYETAWTWLHKFRRAMVRPGRDLLTGRVEVDECYVGGLEEGLPGRLNLQKALVIVAAQEDGPGIGRIRMRQIIDASAASLMPFVQAAVAPGSVIRT